MADPFPKSPGVSSKATSAPNSAVKPAGPGAASGGTSAATRLQDRVSLGLVSMLLGGIALSLDSVRAVRFLAVLLSLVGVALAVMEFRSPVRDRRQFGRAIAGALLCGFILLLTAVRPLWSGRAAPAAAARTRINSIQQTAEAPQAASSPSQPVAADNGVSEAPTQTANSIPEVIPFHCGKHLRLISVEPDPEPEENSPSGDAKQDAAKNTDAKAGPANAAAADPQKPHPKELQWLDAASDAALQGELAVCVASAKIERLALINGNNTFSSATDNLVIHVEVLLTGTMQTINFEGWSNANFGDSRHKPTLSDTANNTYKIRIFPANTQIADHEKSKGLYPRLYADEYLIFDLPRANTEALRLELPASAFGGTGTLCFQIPKSMIERADGNQAAK